MNPYDPYTNPNPHLRARNDDVTEILSLLGSSHVSVVAPKFFGKRALLREIATRAKANKEFSEVIIWDMKNQPANSGSFFQDLAQQIWDQWPAAAKFFPKGVSGISGERFIGACSDWQLDNHRLLFLWSGFDRVLRDTELPENLLGQLVSLTGNDGVRVVVSTRREMPDLVVNQADIGSVLWGRFVVHRLKSFSGDDMKAVMADFEQNDRTFAPGAEAAIAEQTGNVPPLVFALLSQLWKDAPQASSIAKPTVMTAADAMDNRVLKESWRDLSADAQRTMRLIAKSSDGVPSAGISDQQTEELQHQLGVIRKAGGKFFTVSRLYAEFATRQDCEGGQLALLFGNKISYGRNMAEALRHRFEQVKLPMSQELSVSVRNILINMEECAAVSLDTVRRVFTGAASILLKRHFPDGKIPDQVIRQWRAPMPEFARTKSVPRTRGAMMDLLRRLHDAQALNPPQAEALFQLLFDAGNMAQHDDEHEPVSGPFAIAVATAAVELLVLLEQST